MKHRQACFLSCVLLWCAAGAFPSATAVTPACGPASPVVEVTTFSFSPDTDSVLRIAQTAERKLVEFLVMNGVCVASPLTGIPPAQGNRCRFGGRATVSDTSATVTVHCSRNGSEFAAGTVLFPVRQAGKLRNVFGETLLYALDLELPDLRVKSDTLSRTRSPYEYALALLNAQKAAGARSKPGAGEDVLSALLATSRAIPYIRAGDGLWCRKFAVDPFGLSVVVWAIDCKKNAVEICMQSNGSGNRIDELAASCGGDIALSGGFFEMGRGYALSPSGCVVSQGAVVSPVTAHGGSGVFYIRDSEPGITWAKDFMEPDACSMAIQCGPVLVENNGKMGIFSNDFVRLNRAAVGISKGRVLLTAVSGPGGKGLSLYEFASFLRAAEPQGGCECVTAMNLDGGLSVQMWSQAGGEVMHVRGVWAINNALVVRKER